MLYPVYIVNPENITCINMIKSAEGPTKAGLYTSYRRPLYADRICWKIKPMGIYEICSLQAQEADGLYIQVVFRAGLPVEFLVFTI